MDVVCLLLQLYVWVIIARSLMSWVRVQPGTPVASIYSVIYNLTEPVLGPIRGAIPPMRMGMGAMDVSPLLVIIGIIVLQNAIC